MRLLPFLSLLGLLAGCAGAAAPPQAAPVDQIGADFPKGGIVDVIVVDATGNQPLRSAALIAPDGTATPAFALETNPAATVATGQATNNNPFTAHIAAPGYDGALAPLSAESGTALRGEARLLAIVSTASIRLPDPVAYRRDWRRYHIRLELGDPPTAERRDIAAPAPAAN